MRTIKFRGKRLDGQGWVVGYYAESDEYGDNGGCEHNYRETITTLYYIVDRDGKPELVLHESVGQWTGRTDKNGAELYEGDVVKIFVYYYDYDGSKYWMEDECRLGRVTFQDGGFYLGATPLMHISADEYEIIPDNPELMEVE